MLLAIDLGTASVKTLLMDRDGAIADSASVAYASPTSPPDWSETHPSLWWQACVAAINRLDAGKRRAVCAIGLAGQMHGVVLCDANGSALRPALTWLDTRGAVYLAHFPVDTAQRTGNAPAAGFAASSLLWLQAHEPRHYNAARWALQPKDWLRFQLCAQAATDASDATGTQLATLRGAWDAVLIAALGLRADWLPQIQAAHSTAGMLTAAAASELGLSPGITVATGASDTAAAALGSGLLRDGDAQLTTGTGGQIVSMRTQCPGYRAGLNAFRTALDVGGDYARWYAMAALLNVGAALEWVRTLLGYSWDEAYAAANEARSEGLVFLPYLAGERTPLMDAHARGAWIGLSGTTGRAEMMHAAFEGVAFSLRAGLDCLIEAGHNLDELRLAGGGSLHPWWRQLLADALQRPLHAVAIPDAAARGAALLAGIAIGHWTASDLAQLAPPRQLAAQPHTDAALAARYQRYQALSPLLRAWRAG